ncbi:MAG: MaoC family dehydratase N-terminal domain-containing protein [Rhodocyclaceae bacterium]|nr:MaoC family dehydratase N-terminal domain-containing protein [Rhodocyclaceae bacterium]MBX3668469.1 MaoC family dehydratase N-terminal domain-containing protein [Rhodocyclaceae bacterium]
MPNTLPALSTDIEAWIGKEETSVDGIDLRTAQALAATLDVDPESVQPGTELPPLWHWVYFTPRTRQSQLGPDGHARRGNFLPQVDLPNRMWAGSRIDFLQPIHIDEQLTRLSRVARCERKTGRHGELIFVTVAHIISGPHGVAIRDEHDIVYRHPTPRDGALAGEAPQHAAEFRRTVLPDPVLLFRYSALTFNGHRIHYDHPYVTQVEGYPDLVVHGPLTATLLLEAFRDAHPQRQVTRFAFRAVGPLFANTAFDLCGRCTAPGTAKLWTDCAGRCTMKADVEFR